MQVEETIIRHLCESIKRLERDLEIKELENEILSNRIKELQGEKVKVVVVKK